MNIELITKEHLDELKKEMIKEVTTIISKQKPQEWLKSKEVRKYLNCSEGTLINLRNTGKLPYSKVSGTIYYRNSDLNKLLESNLVA